MKTWLSYYQIFNQVPTKEEIIHDIKSFDLNEALLILAKLSLLDGSSKQEIIDNINPYINDRDMIDSVEPFDLLIYCTALNGLLRMEKQLQNIRIKINLLYPLRYL